ncbi:hypothetical protein PSTEL_12015 [Paenibacillus stellifer]|uniref:AMP-dependent synthetase n=1 Tax=Paenibacillus stellifer TaxID=169760 RepID=A0A089N4L6_9BACL|nr:class I adenylate-forming enzyme family protein [Paenibacillus stellifer]AIQ63699.1 hypothetical protein PSTEL_12015 [Paenibacillus stellifer]
MGTIFAFLADRASGQPDRTYIEEHHRSWSYREVFDLATGLAGHLARLGIGEDDRVLLWMDNSAEYIIAYFAVLRAGAIAVPVSPAASGEHLRFILDDVAPKAILTHARSAGRVSGPASERHAVVLPVDEWVKAATAAQRHMPAAAGLPSAEPERVALILYTSGTTRNPKGVMLTHRNLEANTESILAYLPIQPEDSLLVAIPFYYAYGNSLILTQTKAGGTLYLDNRAAFPVKILERLRDGNMSGFSTVGSYLHLLLKQDTVSDLDFAGLKYLTVAGEACSAEDVDRLSALAPGLSIYMMYGQTEAAARLSYLEPPLLPLKRGSIGRAIPGVELRVVNDDGMEVRPGEIGEIIASGPNIMKGYWNNRIETEAAVRDGWLHTGDLATADSEGFLYIKGRKNDIIKYLGHRISPLEVETAINQCEGVLECAVVESEIHQEKQIVAYVVRQDENCDENRIDRTVRKILPPYKRPHAYRFIGSLPRTANGKIKRSELRSSEVHPNYQ